MTEQQIIIQNHSRQLQVAVLEDGRLAEYFVQRSDGSPVSGSVYRGVVESVLPGMQAAFVDIGWERNAYLALEDVAIPKSLEGCKPRIGDVLKAGQSIVVQIKKEAVDAKGPKVSSKLSLPGRTLVLVPGEPYAAVSKKIADEKRQRLKELADELLAGQQCGLIVRTAGQDCSKAELQQEFQWLLGRWQQLQAAMEQVQKPGLIQADQDLAAQVIRDRAREADLEGIYVNDFQLYQQLQQQLVPRQLRSRFAGGRKICWSALGWRALSALFIAARFGSKTAAIWCSTAPRPSMSLTSTRENSLAEKIFRPPYCR